MSRIMIQYPDKTSTYFTFGEDDNGAYLMLGGQRYTVKDIADTGALAVVNTPEVLRKLQSYGMPCRPTPKQTTQSVSLSADTKERLRIAAKKTGQTVSSIIEKLAVNWLEENGM